MLQSLSSRIAAGLVPILLATGPADSAEDPGCALMTAQYAARRGELAAPQVSAALFAASDHGCAVFAGQLLEQGASVAARDRNGGTALTHAARSGEGPVIRLLAAHGADIDHRNLQGSTPLYAAVEQDRVEAASVLLILGSKVNLPGKAGVSPVSAAAFNGNAALVAMLLAHGADPGLQDDGGKAPILYAAARGAPAIVAQFLAAGVDVNASYNHQLSVLHWAAGYADGVAPQDALQVVDLLLAKGARVDETDDRGQTPLMTAAALGHGAVVDLLLAHAANPRLRDAEGNTAAALAATDAIRASLDPAHSPAR